jgi:hypothetical protein
LFPVYKIRLQPCSFSTQYGGLFQPAKFSYQIINHPYQVLTLPSNTAGSTGLHWMIPPLKWEVTVGCTKSASLYRHRIHTYVAMMIQAFTELAEWSSVQIRNKMRLLRILVWATETPRGVPNPTSGTQALYVSMPSH